MTTTTQSPARLITTPIVASARAGALGGLVAGMVFGMAMSMMDMMSAVAMLVGSHSLFVGWMVHMMISIGTGVAFAVALPRLNGVGAALGVGMAYGMALWVGGALIAMPARLGMPVLAFDAMAWKSLMGHLMFGAILGAVVASARRRQV